MTTTCNNIQDAILELKKQIAEPDFYAHNYELINNCIDYLDIAEKQCNEMGEEFDMGEQLYYYLADDLQWDDRKSELFPMEL